MLRDIVFRTNLDVFRRALLGDPPARVEPMTLRLQPGAGTVRATPGASPIVNIAGNENCWADLLSRWVTRSERPVCTHASVKYNGGASRWERQVSDEGGCARRAGDRCGGRTHP